MFEIKADRTGKKLKLTALVNNEPITVETIPMASGAARRRIAIKWLNDERLHDSKADGVTVESIEHRIEKADLQLDAEGAPDDEQTTPQAAILTALANTCELFHYADEPYATAPVGDHRETMRVTSKAFKSWLVRQYYTLNEKPPGSQALYDAIQTCAARAMFDGPEIPVSVRVAQHGECIYIDLADEQWRAVRVGPDGWAVVNEPPVRFIRPKGMRPLPAPISGGSINTLRNYVNVLNEDDWALLLAWLVTSFYPTGPYTVLLVHGEQGACKSTTSHVLRSLLDPNKAPLRAEPKEGRDLMISAKNSWLCCFDNISRLQPWLSDALCRLSTGGGFAVREHYANDEECLFDAERPILISGIEEVANRSDLLDRAVVLTLAAINDTERREKAELWQAFGADAPAIFGALLDGLSASLRNRPKVKLKEKPRMADFAVRAVAAEPALGLKRGAFLDAYLGNRAQSHETAIESSAIGQPLLGLVAGLSDGCDDGDGSILCRGTAQELLTELSSDRHSNDTLRKRSDWPRKPRGLTAALKRLAPNLRAVGVNVAFLRRESGGTPIAISKTTGGGTVTTYTTDTNRLGGTENAVSAMRVGFGQPSQPTHDRHNLHTEIRTGATENAINDGNDGCERSAGDFSDEAERQAIMSAEADEAGEWETIE